MLSKVATDPGHAPLPALRSEIRIEQTGADEHAQPIAIVVDPVRGAYYRLQWPESALLPLWRSCATRRDLCNQARDQFHLQLTDTDIDDLITFLHQSQLTTVDPSGSWRRFHALAEASQETLSKRLVHNYLFFRIPLFHPQAYLQKLAPRLEFIFSRWMLFACLTLSLTGSYLISRQWGEFEAMFRHSEKLPSLALFAVVLLVLKAIHEMGHAVATVRLGCRVPSMGVAFMLGTPVFYTDTTDSWRLPRKADRLGVVVAGVGAELIVAALAAFCWPFLDDGLGRQICFAIMTSSVVTTLLINLNPFMRYDGYFALSDYLDVPNLQLRAFALARWKLREVLFSLGHEAPEVFTPHLEKTLITYAWLTWIYRVVLFLGIAAVVYAIVLKALGILLGLFEIVFFVLRPIAHEILEWWGMRSAIVERRRIRTSMVAASVALAVVFVPWMRVVESPAVLLAEKEEALHVSAPARVISVHVVDGQSVEQGEILFRTESPELQTSLAKARLELQALKMQSAQLPSLDRERETRLIIIQQISRAAERIASLERLQKQLDIRAPFTGTIVDLDVNVRPGVWQSPALPLARVIVASRTRARGVVRDTDLGRIANGADAVFIPDDTAAPSRPMRLEAIAAASTSQLSEPALADTNGGPVATIEEHGAQISRYGSFEVSFVSDDPAPSSVIRGTVRIEASATSPFTSAWRQVARVLVREQGF
jgi:putative peptide zinc metalloprotease protein